MDLDIDKQAQADADNKASLPQKYHAAKLEVLRYLMEIEHYQYFLKDNEQLQDFSKRSSRDFPKEEQIDAGGSVKTVELEKLSNGQSTLTISSSVTNLHNASYIGPDYLYVTAFEEANPATLYNSVISVDGSTIIFLASSPNGVVVMAYYAGQGSYQSAFLSPVDVAQKPQDFLPNLFNDIKSQGADNFLTYVSDFGNWDITRDQNITSEQALVIWGELSKALKPVQKNR